MPKPRNKKTTISHPLYRNAFIYKRDEVIYTCITIDGVRYRETTNLTWHANNFKRAERILELRWEKLNYDDGYVEPIPLNDLFEQYLQYKSKSVTAATIKKYHQAWSNFVKKNYTHLDIDKFKLDLIQLIGSSHLHNNSINKSLQMLSAFFKHLIDTNIIEKNPITSSILPKMKLDEPVAYTEEELSKLISHFGKSHKMSMLIQLIMNTGLRISEALSLSSDSFSEGCIIVKGKGGHIRKIPIPLNSELSNIVDFISKEKKYFHWENITAPINMLKRACNLLSINATGFHSIRKYFENKLIDAGANIKATAEILGHTVQIQSKHYTTKSKIKTLQDTMQILNKNNNKNNL